MLNALIIAEDQQILNGTGLAGQMLGILAAARAWRRRWRRTAPAYADAILEQYMAIYAATYIQPTGVVLAPDALVNVATSKASTTGAYFLTGAPFDRSPMPLSIWGLPTAISPALASRDGAGGRVQVGSDPLSARRRARGGERVA